MLEIGSAVAEGAAAHLINDFRHLVLDRLEAPRRQLHVLLQQPPDRFHGHRAASGTNVGSVLCTFLPALELSAGDAPHMQQVGGRCFVLDQAHEALGDFCVSLPMYCVGHSIAYFC